MKLVGNWYQKLIGVACDAVGHKQDYRFRPWVKTVDSVDREKSDGYCFNGKFINDGTTEIEVKPRLFLVMTSSGSRRYQQQHYNVIAMDEFGNLSATNIHTDNNKPGWALRIRDATAALLKEMEKKSEHQPTDV